MARLWHDAPHHAPPALFIICLARPGLALLRRIDELRMNYPAQSNLCGLRKLARMGSQFTSTAFTSVLLREKIAISMDGRGAWRDNLFVEACPMIPRITGCCAVAFSQI